MQATIDRIERDEEGREMAVLVFDDGQQLVVPRDLLPPGARSQQAVDVLFRVNPGETERRAAEIEKLQRELFGQ